MPSPPPSPRPLRPWIALHGERWNHTDVDRLPDERTAGFLWAAHSGPDWIVAYRVGGIACCSTRFALLLPTRRRLRAR